MNVHLALFACRCAWYKYFQTFLAVGHCRACLIQPFHRQSRRHSHLAVGGLRCLRCYKKELGFSTHKKKRMKQVKKSGQLDPTVDDPCGASKTWAGGPESASEKGDQSRLDMQGSVHNV